MIAIIPARAGSKGLPDKNIKKLGGKPLIAHTIEAAQKSNIFEQIVVSTDSIDIAGISKEYGASVPFLRPSWLSDDKATTISVVEHFVDFCMNTDIECKQICLLQPTSPLRTAEDIVNAFVLFQEKRANAVVSVCECDHSPLWSNTIDKDLRMDTFIPRETKNTRRQDLPKYFRLNGAIYMANSKFVINNNGFIGENTIAYIMDKKNSIDIDDIYDFEYAKGVINYYGGIQ